MSKEQEQKLVNCVEKAVALTARGMSPTEAIVKVANENDLNTLMAKRVAEAYNASKTLHHLSEKQGKDRLDTFSIASPDSISDRLMESNTKSATHLRSEASVSMPRIGQDFISDIQRAERIKALKGTESVKEAQDETILPRPVERQSAFQRREDDYIKYAQSKIAYQERLEGFNDEFRGGLTQESLHEVMFALSKQYPSSYEKIAKMIDEKANLSKMGFDLFNFDVSNMTLTDILASSKPYATLENLIKSSVELHGKAEKYAKSKQAFEDITAPPVEKTASETSMFSARGLNITPNLQQEYEKEAAPFFPLTGSAYNLFRSATDPANRREQIQSRFSNELSSTLNTLDDPDIRDATNQIRIRAMLNNFLTEDEVISSHDEDEVLEAFNAISSVSPNVAMHSPVMRDLIRKYLVNGGLESLEIGQATELGKNIGDRRSRAEMLTDLSASATPTFGGVTLSTQGKPTDSRPAPTGPSTVVNNQVTFKTPEEPKNV